MYEMLREVADLVEALEAQGLDVVALWGDRVVKIAIYSDGVRIGTIDYPITD